MMACSISRPSPNSMIVLPSAKSGFGIPAKPGHLLEAVRLCGRSRSRSNPRVRLFRTAPLGPPPPRGPSPVPDPRHVYAL